MSGLPSGTTPRKAPKAMSSRLANMKFMQRAASETTLPSSPDTPVSDSRPSSKRIKMFHTEGTPLQGKGAGMPSHGDTTRRLGVAGAETMWTLDWAGMSESIPGPSVDEDEGDEEPDPWADGGGHVTGRVRYGGFKKVQEKAATNGEEGDDALDGDSNSDSKGSDEDSEARRFAEQNVAKVREVRAQRSKADRDKSKKPIGERKKKEVRLNPLGSGRKGISSGGR